MKLSIRNRLLSSSLALGLALSGAALAQDDGFTVQVTLFQQTVAEAAAPDRDLAAFYRDHQFEPVWTGAGEVYTTRRRAFLAALERADDHGLPGRAYDVPGMIEAMRAARTDSDRALLDVKMSRMFLDFAADLQTGVLTPSRIDSGIVREIPLRAAS